MRVAACRVLALLRYTTPYSRCLRRAVEQVLVQVQLVCVQHRAYITHSASSNVTTGVVFTTVNASAVRSIIAIARLLSWHSMSMELSGFDKIKCCLKISSSRVLLLVICTKYLLKIYYSTLTCTAAVIFTDLFLNYRRSCLILLCLESNVSYLSQFP